MSGFVAGGIVAVRSAWYEEKGAVLIATATLSLTLPSPPTALTEQGLDRLRRLGFKIGFLLEDTLRAEEFVAAGVRALESAPVGADLTRVFGSSPGRRWVGFIFTSAPPPESISPNVARYQVSLRLAGVRQFPQLVPAPSRYGNETSFADSHLSALWVIERPKA
jgi:hypothetical protein